MRIPSKTDLAESAEEAIPSEVQIWLDKGWTIIPSERRGFVISGEKKMRGLDKAGLIIGFLLLAGFIFGYLLPGILGVVLLGGAWLDFKFNTKPPTMFFPSPARRGARSTAPDYWAARSRGWNPRAVMGFERSWSAVVDCGPDARRWATPHSAHGDSRPPYPMLKLLQPVPHRVSDWRCFEAIASDAEPCLSQSTASSPWRPWR